MRVVCQSDAQLDDESRQGLLCQIGESPQIDGTYEETNVVCNLCEPIDEKSFDVENNRFTTISKVYNRKGEVIYEGVPIVDPKHADQILDDASSPKPPSKKKSLKERYGALLPFVIISTSYILYTITDGAIRMIVLLEAYQRQFSALEVAIIFTVNEAAGVVTNLVAGLLGARWGIKTTLLLGLSMQLVGLGMLFGWQGSWPKAAAMVYLMVSQVLVGIAKDLTKLGGKTVTKLVTPEGKESNLFRLVSLITGWKNSLKGVGYFLGAVTVSVSYYLSLGILCVLILLAMPLAVFGLSNQLGRTRKENVRLSQLLKSPYNVNYLSFSRIFLFGSRDLWFDVPLPFFLRSAASGFGWSRPLAGAFLAIYIIVYGQVQSWTPQLVLQPLRQSPPNKYTAIWWCITLVIPTTILGGIMAGTGVFGPGVAAAPAIVAFTVLLYTFNVLFAVNSAIHSYLIVQYSEGDKVAMQVGVYYASNAMGRTIGTLFSGILYTYAGDTVVISFAVCVFTSVAFVIISTLIEMKLREDAVGANWLSPFEICMGKKQSVESQQERESALTSEEVASPIDPPAAAVEIAKIEKSDGSSSQPQAAA